VTRYSEAQLEDAFADVRKHIAALEADNARLRAQLAQQQHTQ
jgi:uncharacterized small protein (DUF1192 family)